MGKPNTRETGQYAIIGRRLGSQDDRPFHITAVTKVRPPLGPPNLVKNKQCMNYRFPTQIAFAAVEGP